MWRRAARMSRAVRFTPLALFLLVVAALVWRLATPADTDVRSKLEGQPVPAFALPAALPGQAGVASADLRRASRAWSISSPAGACRASPKRRCCSN